ncbi:hypothetical protein LCGC14_0777930 [marine sediment metagenome]|uniref:Uncharacterized protein n=1 Tax=marine sediment metagenome TaxID=412755 RepID=A0A0F9SG93_9ZZZZ
MQPNAQDKQETDGGTKDAIRRYPPTINRTGFPLTDAAIKALGPDGPGIYDQAKKDLGFPDGPYTSVTDTAIADRMSLLVNRANR